MKTTSTPVLFMEDEHFLIRTYAKRELVHLYLPHLPIRSALRAWNEWVNVHPTLREALIDAGYRKCCKFLTPVQVKLVVEAFGAP